MQESSKSSQSKNMQLPDSELCFIHNIKINGSQRDKTSSVRKSLFNGSEKEKEIFNFNKNWKN
jgi:hypothetical protein